MVLRRVTALPSGVYHIHARPFVGEHRDLIVVRFFRKPGQTLTHGSKNRLQIFQHDPGISPTKSLAWHTGGFQGDFLRILMHTRWYTTLGRCSLSIFYLRVTSHITPRNLGEIPVVHLCWLVSVHPENDSSRLQSPMLAQSHKASVDFSGQHTTDVHFCAHVTEEEIASWSRSKTPECPRVFENPLRVALQ